jgi:hypothetical protein
MTTTRQNAQRRAAEAPPAAWTVEDGKTDARTEAATGDPRRATP